MNPDAERLRTGLGQLSRELGAGDLSPAPRGAVGADVDALRAALATTSKADWPRLAVALNEDQVESKIWLVEELSRALEMPEHRIVILGAWYGMLSFILHGMLRRPPEHITCVDIDEKACGIARHLLAILSPTPEVKSADMMELDHVEIGLGRPTVFVNTSCEHLKDFARWRSRVPKGAFLVLQSNDHWGCSEHVNCVPNLGAFEDQARLSHVDFGGTLPLKRFQRFMLIGRA